MSIETRTVIKCDAVMCTQQRVVTASTLPKSRALLKTQGWSRRHHGEAMVDLCPSHKDYVTDDSRRGGRPRNRQRAS